MKIFINIKILVPMINELCVLSSRQIEHFQIMQFLYLSPSKSDISSSIQSNRLAFSYSTCLLFLQRCVPYFCFFFILDNRVGGIKRNQNCYSFIGNVFIFLSSIFFFSKFHVFFFRTL